MPLPAPSGSRDDLSHIEQALLWTMRAWVIGHCHGIDVAGRIADVYDGLGVPEAAEALDDLMRTLGQGALRVLEVNCVCNDAVSDDEMKLLRAVALHQYMRCNEADCVLGTLTADRFVSPCSDAAQCLAYDLLSFGHRLPEHPGYANGADPFGPDPVWATPASPYLH